MSGFQLSISGLAELKGRLDKMSNLLPQVQHEMETAAANIDMNAKQNAAVNFGTLQQTISWDPVGGDTVEVVATAEYAPYVEFGTGGLVDVPEGLEEYAMTFKGAGVKKVNLPARPFLFPAFAVEKPLLIERIIKIIES